jgi:hypothetical protein
MKRLLPFLVILAFLAVFFSSCTPSDYSDCNTLLHEGKIIWASSVQYANTITFADGFSFTGNSMGVSDYDGQVYDFTNCGDGNCPTIIARHTYTGIEYKLYGNQSKAKLFLVPYDLDAHKPPALTK